MSNLKEFNLVIRNQNTQAYLQDVLGEKKETFVSNLTALVSNDTKLQECKPVTLMYAALTATALDLPLDKTSVSPMRYRTRTTASEQPRRSSNSERKASSSSPSEAASS